MDHKKQAIDWEEGAQLAANNEAIAVELMAMLIKELPADLDKIKQAYERKDFDTMQNSVHKLKGATCYCGVPELRKTTTTLETLLTKGTCKLEPAFHNFAVSIEDLLKAAKLDPKLGE